MTAEETQTLEDIISTEEYWSVILKAVQAGVERARENVLTCDVQESDRKIAFAKARLEGAEALQMFIMNLKRRKREKKDAR